MSIFAPSASSVQKKYVDLRKRTLFANDPAKTARVQTAIERLAQKHRCGDDWLTAYKRITHSLQSSPLCINITAWSWFEQDNTYDTYKQMYERAVDGRGRMHLKGNALNPAAMRAGVDDTVTLPEEWRKANMFSDKKRVYNALNMSSAKTSTLPGGVVPQGTTINVKGEAVPKLRGDEASGFGTKNRAFQPDAKQVFAALNYGKRPNGATQRYGWSQLILKPALHQHAIYFMGDTFYTFAKGAAQQATYNTLGALIEHAIPDVADDIWKSCHQGHSLANESKEHYLLEAHIFRKIKIAQDVEMLVLSRREGDTGVSMPRARWDEVKANALRWGQRFNVRVVYSPT